VHRDIGEHHHRTEQPKEKPQAAEKPKVEKPKAEKKEKPAEKPKAEKKEGAEKPKTEKPKTEKPKTEKPKTEKPKAEKKEGAEKSKADKKEKPKDKKAEKPKAGEKPKAAEKPKAVEKPKAAKKDKPKKVKVPGQKKAPPKPKKRIIPRHDSIAVGLKKGFKVHRRPKVPRPSNHKGAITRRVRLIKEIVREVAGFAPYERRVLELLRNNLDKRALKLAKKKLGTHSRGKRKRDELAGVLQRQRAGLATH